MFERWGLSSIRTRGARCLVVQRGKSNEMNILIVVRIDITASCDNKYHIAESGSKVSSTSAPILPGSMSLYQEISFGVCEELIAPRQLMYLHTFSTFVALCYRHLL